MVLILFLVENFIRAFRSHIFTETSLMKLLMRFSLNLMAACFRHKLSWYISHVLFEHSAYEIKYRILIYAKSG